MAAQTDVGGDPGVLRSMWYNDYGGDNESVNADIDSHISSSCFSSLRNLI